MPFVRFTCISFAVFVNIAFSFESENVPISSLKNQAHLYAPDFMVFIINPMVL